jgi:Domain of unknown function (DUF3291)
MSSKLAFLTVAVLRDPVGTPGAQGFVDRIPSVYGSADGSEGFIARSIRDVETWAHSWGDPVAPSCWGKVDDEKRLAMTLNLWADLESVAAFAYHGAHGEALSKRTEWFDRSELPVYVAWWVADDHHVDWNEAGERLDHLNANGPTALAFNFAKPFDAAGEPYRMDRSAVTRKVAVNGK